VNVLLTYAITSDSLTVVYVQFVIMLTKLQKVLSQELKCLCSKTTTIRLEWTIPNTKNSGCQSLFHCITNKYCTEIYVYWI